MANYTLATLDLKEVEYSNMKEKHKLENIDKFTTLFKNEDELRFYLYKKEIMDLEDIKKKFCIYYKYKGEYKRTQYGLAFENDKKYFNPDYLKYHFMSKIDDYEFIQKLVNHYRNSKIQESNLNGLRFYLNKYKNNEFISNKDLEFFQSCLSNFVIREVYDYDSKKQDYKLNNDGTRKIKYKPLHDLALFTSRNKKEIIKDMKKTKKKQIDGQLSLFD